MNLGEIIVGLLNELSVYFVTFIASLSILVFIWGVTKYIYKGDSREERQKGTRLMLWGTIALFVMFGVWGIVGLIGKTFGVDTVIPQFEGQETKKVDNVRLDPNLNNNKTKSEDGSILDALKNSWKNTIGDTLDEYDSGYSDYRSGLEVDSPNNEEGEEE
jgi:hypothetical protein